MKVTEFKDVLVERTIRSRGSWIGARKQIVTVTREYRRMMKLIEECQAQGGHVDFRCVEGKVDATLHWPEKEGVL